MRRWPAVWLMGLLSVSCIEIYEQKFPLQKDIFLVEGMLLDHPDYQYVKVYLTDSGRIRKPVEFASVFIHDGLGNSWELEPVDLGVYHPAEILPLTVGETYQLEVAVGNSIHVFSEWEAVPEPVAAKELGIEIKFKDQITDDGYMITQKGIELFANTAEFPGEEIYIRWSYEISYGYLATYADPASCSECASCVITEQSYTTRVAGTVNGTGKSLKNVPIDFIPIDERFNVRFAVLLKQFSISKRAYEFYETIQQIQDTRGNIFDPPPAIITGNLGDRINPDREIYGLFEVGRYSEVSNRVTNAEIPFLVPTFFERCHGTTLADCFDCREREGATKIRPHYY